jgi:hypothetical protein
MKEEQYLTERLQDQIDWYDQKSQFNQKWFKWLRMTEKAFVLFFKSFFCEHMGLPLTEF